MENRDKIIKGLEIAYQRLVEFKKYKKSPLVTLKDGKIIKIAPEDILPAISYKC